MIAPALQMLAVTMVLLGELDEGERWLRRTERALQTDAGPDIRLVLHQTAGMLHAGRGRHREALQEFGAAEDLASQLAGSQALASQVTGWLLATQARAGLTGQARAALAAMADERADAGEIRNARAVICLADGDPAGALAAVADVLDGTASVRAAAHAPLDHPGGVAGLLGSLREAGADEQAAALLARDPAAHAVLGNSEVVASLLDSLRQAGAHEQAAALATRLPAAGMFGLFLEQQGPAERFHFGREADGTPAAPWGWEDLELWPVPRLRGL